MLRDDIERQGLALVPIPRSFDVAGRGAKRGPPAWSQGKHRCKLTRAEKLGVMARQEYKCGRVGCPTYDKSLTLHNCEVTHAAMQYVFLTDGDLLQGCPPDRREAEIKLLFDGALLHNECHAQETRSERRRKCADDAAAMVEACGLPAGSGVADILVNPQRVQEQLKAAWLQSAGHRYEMSRHGELLWECPAADCPRGGRRITGLCKPLNYSWRLSTNHGVPKATPAVLPPFCPACVSSSGRRQKRRSMVAVKAASDGEPAMKPTSTASDSLDFQTTTLNALVRRHLAREFSLASDF
jgi:hypothetical protein